MVRVRDRVRVLMVRGQVMGNGKVGNGEVDRHRPRCSVPLPSCLYSVIRARHAVTNATINDHVNRCCCCGRCRVITSRCLINRLRISDRCVAVYRLARRTRTPPTVRLSKAVRVSLPLLLDRKLVESRLQLAGVAARLTVTSRAARISQASSVVRRELNDVRRRRKQPDRRPNWHG